MYQSGMLYISRYFSQLKFFLGVIKGFFSFFIPKYWHVQFFSEEQSQQHCNPLKIWKWIQYCDIPVFCVFFSPLYCLNPPQLKLSNAYFKFCSFCLNITLNTILFLCEVLMFHNFKTISRNSDSFKNAIATFSFRNYFPWLITECLTLCK